MKSVAFFVVFCCVGGIGASVLELTKVSNWSDSKAVATTKADTIQNLTLTPHERSIDASWDVAHPSGSIAQYTVDYQSIDHDHYKCSVPDNATSTKDSVSCAIISLTSCTNYSVTVTALDDAGVELSSEGKVDSTLIDDTFVLGFTCEAQTDSYNNVTIYLQWNDVGTCINSLYIDYYISIYYDYEYNPMLPESGTLLPTGDSYTMYPVRYLSNYEFVFYTSPSISSTGKHCYVVTPEVAPPAPNSVYASAHSNYVDLTWYMDKNVGFIVLYRIQWQCEGDLYTDYVPGSESSYVITDVTPEEHCIAWVSAKTNEWGPSQDTEFVVEPEDPSPEGWVIGVSVTVCCLAILLVIWILFGDAIKSRCC